MPRKVDKAARRAELVDAAAAAFGELGVAHTAVSDIVARAGVAQGTFYLYFDTKEDVLVALAERLVGGVIDAAEAALPGDRSAVEQLRGFIGALAGAAGAEGSSELAELLHRPENLSLHHRLEERIVPRLLPLMEGIVAQGAAEGAFRVADTKAAAWFVLGGLRGAELAGTPTQHMPEALAAGLELALRALGHEEVA